jgi:hypothetical protein
MKVSDFVGWFERNFVENHARSLVNRVQAWSSRFTNSTQLNHYSGINNHPAGREILSLLCSPMVHCRLQNSPPLHRVVSLLNAFHTHTSFVFSINFNIILTCMPRSPNSSHVHDLQHEVQIKAVCAVCPFTCVFYSGPLLQNPYAVFILLSEDNDGLSILILFYLRSPVADTCLRTRTNDCRWLIEPILWLAHPLSGSNWS